MTRNNNNRNPVVLMVGGAGMRLRPLTENCPKSLLLIHGKPLLERMIEFLAEFGHNDIYLAIGGPSLMLQEHFQDGSPWNVKITYLIEEEPLGTCGALRLLAKKPDKPILVLNGDLITNIDLECLLKFHSKKGAHATICISKYLTAIPYGVVEESDGSLDKIVEKPTIEHWINAGIYVLEPEVLDLLPMHGRFDMPDLMSLCTTNGGVSVYRMTEDWIDIGSLDEYHKANREPLPTRKAQTQG